MINTLEQGLARRICGCLRFGGALRVAPRRFRRWTATEYPEAFRDLCIESVWYRRRRILYSSDRFMWYPVHYPPKVDEKVYIQPKDWGLGFPSVFEAEYESVSTKEASARCSHGC